MSIKLRNFSNLIKTPKDENGIKVDDVQGIKSVALGFYQRLLGISEHSFSEDKAYRVSHLVKRKFSA
jgi:hypothetical protein